MTLLEGAVLPKPPAVQIYFIPKISMSDIVSVFSDGKMVDPSAKFAEVADQPAFFAALRRSARRRW